MAPWPEQGNELKSIDKVNEIRSSSFDETQHQPKTDPLDDKGKPGKVDDSQVIFLHETSDLLAIQFFFVQGFFSLMKN